MARLPPAIQLAHRVARLPGLRTWTTRTLVDYRLARTTYRLLPPGSQPLRVLHLSDLHVETLPDRGRALCAFLSHLDADVCVITGDLRDPFGVDLTYCLEVVERILEATARQCSLGVYATLGNHDLMQMVGALESLGMRVLRNEGTLVGEYNRQIWLAGVDDPHTHRTHDVDAAIADAPRTAPVVLLAHSSEAANEATACGVDLYLCGHTHGGQVCTPWGSPLWRNLRGGPDVPDGAWSLAGMQGYTSRGVGSSLLPLRLFCPPEVVVHELTA